MSLNSSPFKHIHMGGFGLFLSVQHSVKKKMYIYKPISPKKKKKIIYVRVCVCV